MTNSDKFDDVKKNLVRGVYRFMAFMSLATLVANTLGVRGDDYLNTSGTTPAWVLIMAIAVGVTAGWWNDYERKDSGK